MQFYSRDVQILRQSQIKLVLEYLTTMNVQVSVEELQRITDIFVEYGLKPADEDLIKKVKSLDKWLEQKKLEQHEGRTIK